MLNLADKTALITGGGSGIGRAISVLFAQQGAEVHILEHNLAAAQDTVAQILAAGGSAQAHQADVGQLAEIEAVMAQLSRLNILVNNAGIAHVGSLENTTELDFDKVLTVNVKGVYHGMMAALPLLKLNGGVILNLASIAGWVGLADRFAYSMSKGAVQAMTLSVARDYLHAGIRCNALSPARVHTPFVDGFIAKNYPENQAEIFEKLSKTQPIGRMGTPQEVAMLALYLCSDEASFITGCDYPIDGGFIKLNTP
jgi:2-keto-3-deoxy-L-fuconate dehydrogenase